ncbi:biofilm PGA synthesis lipoprotein PgaB [Acinetobacter marinus]|uniref:Biofilm PGA synthesis lipoprotein PgaB n=2 Tax=Acinetobacter marinus TaxID=281375 RepID=A0A1G6GXT2_9GAMM|nr:biofilm PGA synthesis lipoprotein PgaB [Acinetobacter marinus]
MMCMCIMANRTFATDMMTTFSHQFSKHFFKLCHQLSTLFLIVSLASCGGGASSSNTSSNNQASNNPTANNQTANNQSMNSTSSENLTTSTALSTMTPIDISSHPINEILKQYQSITPNNSSTVTMPEQMRIMHVDLDYVYDADATQLKRNIDALIEQIKTVQPNTVFLQAFADPDGNGSADETYFDNRHLPTRANIFATVSQAIKSNTDVQAIFAWLPVMAWEVPNNSDFVKHANGSSTGYIRLSPFVEKNLQIIADIYQDFAKNNAVDGILFHDDLTLNDYEDAHPDAIKTYTTWGYDQSYITTPLQEKQLQFTQLKTAYLDQLAYGLGELVKKYQPNIKTARNSYAMIHLDNDSERWFAQSLESTYKYYDYNAVMAMPYMEKVSNHQQFYLNLINAAKQYDSDLSHTVFELQSVNWNTQQAIDSAEIIQDMQYLESHGAKHYGYYPDNFFQNHPDGEAMHRQFAQ